MDKNKPRYNEIIFSDEQQQDIINSYLNKESSVKIGERYGVSHKVILKILHENNISVDQKRMVRKYNLDEHYFDKIDTPNKAYILGFLLADGHNENKKSTIQISLQEENRYILEKMRNELQSSKPLEFIDYSDKHDFGYTYKNQYRLEVFSKYMCEKLNDLGMVGEKSNQLIFPSDIAIDLLNHFVRGYFDGNGTISKNRFSIVSTKDFCNGLKNQIDTILGLNYGTVKEASNHNGITHVIGYYRQNEIRKIMEWLYSDAEMFLTRKRQKYLTIFC